MKTTFLLLAVLGLTPPLIAEMPSLQGELKDIPLLQGSKNQPAMAVLVGKHLLFTEAKNLDGDWEKDCPASDLYQYDLTSRQETRIAEVACVLSILSNGEVTYVVSRPAQNEVAVSRVVNGNTVEGAPADTNARMKARVAFKRSTMKLPRFADLVPVTYVLKGKELNAVFATPTHLFLDQVPFDGPSPQGVLAIPFQGSATPALGLSEIPLLYTFTTGKEGWLRIVETDLNGASTILGHERPLPKDWSEVGPLDWAIRTPRFLVGVADGFLVADRSPEAFTEATAISWYSAQAKRFYRLQIPDQDVGGLSYALNGVLVSKPMMGSIHWYGKTSPFKNEVSK